MIKIVKFKCAYYSPGDLVKNADYDLVYWDGTEILHHHKIQRMLTSVDYTVYSKAPDLAEPS